MQLFSVWIQVGLISHFILRLSHRVHVVLRITATITGGSWMTADRLLASALVTDSGELQNNPLRDPTFHWHVPKSIQKLRNELTESTVNVALVKLVNRSTSTCVSVILVFVIHPPFGSVLVSTSSRDKRLVCSPANHEWIKFDYRPNHTKRSKVSLLFKLIIHIKMYRATVTPQITDKCKDQEKKPSSSKLKCTFKKKSPLSEKIKELQDHPGKTLFFPTRSEVRHRRETTLDQT